MANTLSDIRLDVISSAITVEQEAFGAQQAINTNFDNKGVAKGDKVKVPVVAAGTVETYTPANVSPSGTDRTATSVDVEITDIDRYSFRLEGEEEKGLENSGSLNEFLRQNIEQGMRVIRNNMEINLCNVIYQSASRAFGTAGTTPFASSIDILADVRKGLRDNGAPMADMQCVSNTSAIANLQKLDIYQKANENGSGAERTQGTLPRYFGFQIRDTAGIELHTKGTGTGYLINNASGEAVGQTTLTVDTGTGTVVAGDVITHASDATNKYIVNTGITAPGDLVIGNPGLLVAAADDDAVTIGDNYTPNMCFERNAIVGIVRPPEIKSTAVIETMIINDAAGFPYFLVKLDQYGQTSWEVLVAYGFKVVQSQYIMNLMG